MVVAGTIGYDKVLGCIGLHPELLQYMGGSHSGRRLEGRSVRIGRKGGFGSGTFFSLERLVGWFEFPLLSLSEEL